jgi:hypothetical protein
MPRNKSEPSCKNTTQSKDPGTHSDWWTVASIFSRTVSEMCTQFAMLHTQFTTPAVNHTSNQLEAPVVPMLPMSEPSQATAARGTTPLPGDAVTSTATEARVSARPLPLLEDKASSTTSVPQDRQVTVARVGPSALDMSCPPSPAMASTASSAPLQPVQDSDRPSSSIAVPHEPVDVATMLQRVFTVNAAANSAASSTDDMDMLIDNGPEIAITLPGSQVLTPEARELANTLFDHSKLQGGPSPFKELNRPLTPQPINLPLTPEELNRLLSGSLSLGRPITPPGSCDDTEVDVDADADAEGESDTNTDIVRQDAVNLEDGDVFMEFREVSGGISDKLPLSTPPAQEPLSDATTSTSDDGNTTNEKHDGNSDHADNDEHEAPDDSDDSDEDNVQDDSEHDDEDKVSEAVRPTDGQDVQMAESVDSNIPTTPPPQSNSSKTLNASGMRKTTRITKDKLLALTRRGVQLLNEEMSSGLDGDGESEVDDESEVSVPRRNPKRNVQQRPREMPVKSKPIKHDRQHAVKPTTIAHEAAGNTLENSGSHYGSKLTLVGGLRGEVKGPATMLAQPVIPVSLHLSFHSRPHSCAFQDVHRAFLYSSVSPGSLCRANDV